MLAAAKAPEAPASTLGESFVCVCMYVCACVRVCVCVCMCVCMYVCVHVV